MGEEVGTGLIEVIEGGKVQHLKYLSLQGIRDEPGGGGQDLRGSGNVHA